MKSAPLSSEFLRDVADCGCMVLSRAESLILADAMDIADVAARVDIESSCVRADFAGCLWWCLDNIAPGSGDAEYDREVIDRAERYLDARGLIVRHTQNARLVRFVETATQ